MTTHIMMLDREQYKSLIIGGKQRLWGKLAGEFFQLQKGVRKLNYRKGQRDTVNYAEERHTLNSEGSSLAANSTGAEWGVISVEDAMVEMPVGMI